MELKGEKKYKAMRPWQGFLVIILAGIYLFVIAPMFLTKLGLLGSVVGELGFVLLPLAAALLFRWDLGEIFAFHKPAVGPVVGVFLIYLGTNRIIVLLTVLIESVFPEKYTELAGGTALGYYGIPVLVLTAVLAVSPAICEEVLFRGMFVNSLRPLKRKWAILLISGVLFGLFHANPLQTLQLTLMGVVIGYLFLETGNLFYSCMFHFINNMYVVIVIAAYGGLYKYWAQTGELTEILGATQTIALATIGGSMITAAISPLLLYLGNFLLHRNTPGYRDTLFPKNRPGILICLIAVSLGLFLFGVGLIFLDVVMETVRTMYMPV